MDVIYIINSLKILLVFLSFVFYLNILIIFFYLTEKINGKNPFTDYLPNEDSSSYYTNYTLI